MVLEEATSQPDSEANASGNGPAIFSDGSQDTYSAGTSASVTEDSDLGQLLPHAYPQGYRMPWNQLPHALPVFGPMFGFTNAGQLQTILERSIDGSKALKRQLTKEEADAFAWHTSKAFLLSSFGYPIGVGGGIFRWYTTQKLMKFPFYQPNLEKYTFQTLGPFKGRTAFLLWQTIRLNAYGFVGGYVGKQFFGFYAVSVMLVGQVNDSRMKEANEALKRKAVERRNPTNQQSTSPASMDQQNSQTMSQSYRTDNNENLQDYKKPLYSSNSSARDESPQHTDGWSQRGGYTGAAGDDQAWSPQTGRSPPRPITSSYDDASPIAPGDENNSGSSDSAAAWERLRRGGSAPSPPQQSTLSNQRDAPEASEQSVGQDADPWARLRSNSAPTQSQEDGAPLVDQLTEDDSKWR